MTINLKSQQGRPPEIPNPPEEGSESVPESAGGAAARNPRGPPVGYRHLDKRVDQILDVDADAPGDELLSEEQVANWFGVSRIWLRHRRRYGDDGPPYRRLSEKVVRYSRAEVREWLDGRRYTRTADYGKPVHERQ